MKTKNTAQKKYAVGFQKPPVDTRFKPGRSGNPKGRPKGTKNLKTDLAEELNERITIREGTATKTLSKQRILVKALLNKAGKGDVRAANLVFSLVMRLEDSSEGGADTEIELTNDDYEVLETYLQQRRDGDSEAPTEETPK